jgi:hypothetical protein
MSDDEIVESAFETTAGQVRQFVRVFSLEFVSVLVTSRNARQRKGTSQAENGRDRTGDVH